MAEVPQPSPPYGIQLNNSSGALCGDRTPTTYLRTREWPGRSLLWETASAVWGVGVGDTCFLLLVETKEINFWRVRGKSTSPRAG